VGSANLIKGQVKGKRESDGAVAFEAAGGQMLRAHAPSTLTGKEVEVAVRTAYIDVGPVRPGANQINGVIRQRMFHGDFVQYVVDCATDVMIVRRPPTNVLPEGADVTLSFPPEYCVLLEV
jgi:ABC-type Fe3+/spermidine/putrescine transport system ATPase subunit